MRKSLLLVAALCVSSVVARPAVLGQSNAAPSVDGRSICVPYDPAGLKIADIGGGAWDLRRADGAIFKSFDNRDDAKLASQWPDCTLSSATSARATPGPTVVMHHRGTGSRDAGTQRRVQRLWAHHSSPLDRSPRLLVPRAVGCHVRRSSDKPGRHLSDSVDRGDVRPAAPALCRRTGHVARRGARRRIGVHRLQRRCPAHMIRSGRLASADIARRRARSRVCAWSQVF